MVNIQRGIIRKQEKGHNSMCVNTLLLTHVWIILIKLCLPSLPLCSVWLSNCSVPCGLDSVRSLLPLTPPLLLLVSPPLARFRHACTLGGSLWSLAGLLPRAEGHREAHREDMCIKTTQSQHLLLTNEGVVSDYDKKHGDHPIHFKRYHWNLLCYRWQGRDVNISQQPFVLIGHIHQTAAVSQMTQMISSRFYIHFAF